MSWLESAIAGQSPAINLILVVVGLALLLVLSVWLFRRIAGGNRMHTNRSRQPRLSVTDAAIVDDKRRLVLVRRDGVEHLLMIGGPSDIVIEQNIVRVNETTHAQVGPAQLGPAQAEGGFHDDQGVEPVSNGVARAPAQAQAFESFNTAQPDEAFFDNEAFEAEIRDVPFDQQPHSWEEDVQVTERAEFEVRAELAEYQPPQPARRREPAPAPVQPSAPAAPRSPATPRQQTRPATPAASQRPPREAGERRGEFDIGTAGIEAAGAAATQSHARARQQESRQEAADEEEFLSALSAHEAFPGDPASGYPEDFGELLETNLGSHLADEFDENATLDDEVTLDDIAAPAPEPKPASRGPVNKRDQPANKRDQIEDEMQKLLDDLTKA